MGGECAPRRPPPSTSERARPPHTHTPQPPVRSAPRRSAATSSTPPSATPHRSAVELTTRGGRAFVCAREFSRAASIHNLAAGCPPEETRRAYQHMGPSRSSRHAAFAVRCPIQMAVPPPAAPATTSHDAHVAYRPPVLPSQVVVLGLLPIAAEPPGSASRAPVPPAPDLAAPVSLPSHFRARRGIAGSHARSASRSAARRATADRQWPAAAAAAARCRAFSSLWWWSLGCIPSVQRKVATDAVSSFRSSSNSSSSSSSSSDSRTRQHTTSWSVRNA